MAQLRTPGGLPLELPPRFLLLGVGAVAVQQVVRVRDLLRDEVVDDTPVGQTAHVAVVDKQEIKVGSIN